MSSSLWSTWGRSRWAGGGSGGRSGRRRSSTGALLLRWGAADDTDAAAGGVPARARSVWYVPGAGGGADGPGADGGDSASDSSVWLNERHDPCEKRGMSRWYVYQSPVSVDCCDPCEKRGMSRSYVYLSPANVVTPVRSGTCPAGMCTCPR